MICMSFGKEVIIFMCCFYDYIYVYIYMYISEYICIDQRVIRSWLKI